ncbi:stimulated by retinoic acid gene 6 protein-like [Bombina bombina]|uniref:stimulated by retinoic acid gene 6 protein-like n=1 Tax=Bombina bombina TaxID=8345 RepID=UPI00235AA025|nr:stimulated by retinoic acid gene 6 protein-like [Bombina bombina]
MSLSDSRTLPENGTCHEYIDMDLFLHCSLAPSILIILLLSFLERRKNKTMIDDKIQLLNGRFGIVIPLDLIGTFSNRWTFGFAFGAIANKVMSLFFEEYLPEGVPPWARALALLVGAIEVGLSYYPIFACLSTDNKLVGSITGFLYSLVWFVVTTIYIVGCPHGDTIGLNEKVIIYWPSLLCLLFLIVRFVYIFVKSIRILVGVEDANHEEKSFLPVHQAEHVKRLFRKPVLKPKSWFERKIYDWDPCFKFPSRMVGTTVLSLLCLYIFVTLELNVFIWISILLQNLEDNLSQTEGFNDTIWIQELNESFRGVSFFTTFLSVFFSVSYVFHILVCYRKHIKRLWVGEKGFLPIKQHKPYSSECVAALARYSGWQVAYILWGYLIMHLVQIMFGMLFVYSIVYPIKHGEALALLRGWGFSILTLAIVIVLMKSQVMIAAIFFLQDKICPNDKQKPLALNNRKAFHNFNYFFFFYNVILGLSSCLFRLICGLILGSWLIARIDRTLLQRGYESADMGYNTWIGMLYVDHYHTNPVLVSFCNLLLTSRAERRLRESSTYQNCSSLTGFRVSAQAKTRWLLSYTLLSNPRLIINRKIKVLDDLQIVNNVIQNRLIQASVMEAESRNQEKPIDISSVEIREGHSIFF